MVLAKNRWGKLGDEKKKRDMAKAPWTKTGRRETTNSQTREEEYNKTETYEEDEAWEPCGSNEAPKRNKETIKEDEEENKQDAGNYREPPEDKDGDKARKESEDKVEELKGPGRMQRTGW